MMDELSDQLERLRLERQRLEVLLSRLPAWRAHEQLAAVPTPKDAVAQSSLERRRAEVEAQIGQEPLYSAYKSVLAAIGVIEELIHSQKADAQDRANKANGAADRNSADATLNDAMQPVETAGFNGSAVDGGARAGGNSADVSSGVTFAARPSGPPDDLTRIRRIDKGLAAALIARGVRRFADIAAFGSADVRALSAALGLGRRISQENWIEQAAVLAMKAAGSVKSAAVAPLSAEAQALKLEVPEVTNNVRTLGGDRASITPQTVAAEPADPLRPEVAAVVAEVVSKIANRHGSGASIGGNVASTSAVVPEIVTPPVEVIAVEAPVFVMDMVRDAVTRIASGVRPVEEVSRSAGFGSEVVGARVDGRDRRVETEPEDASGSVALAAIAKAEAPEEVAQVGVVEELSAYAGRDDLTLILGIDPGLREQLANIGVTKFQQIAVWDAATVAAMRVALGKVADISGYGWIEQASILARGGMTAHAFRVMRGDYAALAPWPKTLARRDPQFAVWLAAESRGIHSPPVITDVAGVSCDVIAQRRSIAPAQAARVIEIEAEIDPAFDEPVADIVQARDGRQESRRDGHWAKEVGEPVPPAPAPAPAPAPVSNVAPDVRPRPLTIADRITAIERDVARLPVSPRLLYERAQAAAREAAQRADTQTQSRGQTPASVPTPTRDIGFDDHILQRDGAVAADVRIVSGGDRSTAAFESQARIDDAAVHPGPDDFDRFDYAAYRDQVEEASVEIVRPDLSGANNGAGPGGRGGTGSGKESSDAGRVRRFLKALTGE